MNRKFLISLVVLVVVALAGFWLVSSTHPGTPSSSVSPSTSVSVSTSASASPTASQAPNVTITSPKAHQSVDAPIVVTGTARVFENQLTVRLVDSSNKVVYSAHVFTDAKDAGLFGNYRVMISPPANDGTNFTVQAFAPSPKGDGSYQGFVSVPVSLSTSATSNVYAAFLTGGANDCTSTTLFPRTVVRSTGFVSLSLLELLKGPNAQESAEGAKTQIPADTQLNSFRQTSDTAYIDFNNTLRSGANSCRMQAIQAQVTNTIKQFLGINNVVITVDGQPF